MNELDALIAEAEALVMSTRDELLAAGEDENQLARFAAELADLHEPTAVEREEFAYIYSTLIGIAYATPDDMPLDICMLTDAVPTDKTSLHEPTAEGRDTYDIITARVQNEMATRATGEGFARRDAILLGGMLPAKCASWSDPGFITDWIKVKDWAYDPCNNALSFPMREADISLMLGLSHCLVLSFAPTVTSGEQLLQRLNHELKQAEDEVVERICSNPLLSTTRLQSIAFSAPGSSVLYDEFALLPQAAHSSHPDIWAAINPRAHLDSARIHQAVIKAACGPPGGDAQDTAIMAGQHPDSTNKVSQVQH